MTSLHIAPAVACVLTLYSAATGSSPSLGGGGGRPLPAHCITPAERATAQAEVQAYRQRAGQDTNTAGGTAPAPLTFFPMAGDIFGDLFMFNFVDLQPGAGLLDWRCTNWTYDGHNGNDTDIRSFDEQAIGVPIYAAQDGVVIAMHDGEFDMNTSCAGTANYVVIDHGAGRQGYYWHFKKNSVAVTEGQIVRAGDFLGMTGSSGCSTAPHLHFEIHDDGQIYEPFAGACRPGDSGWEQQPAIDTSLYLHDFGVTHQSINVSWPFAWPRTGQIAQSDPVIRVWWYGAGLPANSHWRIRFRRPDGAIAYEGPEQSFNNPHWRWFNWWWTYNTTPFQQMTGTWHVLLSINGQSMIQAPVEVVVQRDPAFNRPPSPVNVTFEPLVPAADRTLTCRVDTSLTLDDPDYDIVRYEYVWTVGGEQVRRVTSAAHSDILPHHVVSAGETVACAVTPRDETAAGPSASVSAAARCAQPFDVTCDGDVDLSDYAAYVECASAPGEDVPPGCESADADGDHDADLLDFGLFMQRYTGDCGVRVTRHPADTQACSNDTVSLTVQTTGDDVEYQWRRNGIRLPNADSAELVIEAVDADSAGTYLAYVTGGCGFDYSRSAHLSVQLPPTIEQQPADVQACEGGAASFQIAAGGGLPPLEYQWQHYGVDVPGATEPTLEINPVQKSDFGRYTCTITDACGSSVPSVEAQLTLAPDPNVIMQPGDAAACTGDDVFLFVSATHAVSYQWFKNGAAIDGATDFFLSLIDSSTDDSGDYHAVVNGMCASVASDAATVEVTECARR